MTLIRLILTDLICVNQFNQYHQCSIALGVTFQKMKRIIISISILYIIGNPFNVISQCNIKNNAFQEGEKLSYEVYYNWGILWLNAGTVSFEVKSAFLNNQKVYHFDSYGSSHKIYDWIFKVRDHYESFATMDTLKSLKFHRKTYEGGFETNNKYTFDKNNKLIYSYVQDSDHPYKEDTLDLHECTYDLLTATYIIRNYDFSKYAIDEKIPISMVIDNEVHDLFFRYRGRGVIQNRNGEIFNCLKFTALLLQGSLFKGGEDLVVWVSDDNNRIPVLIEAKILVGSVKVYLVEAIGLRNEMSSIIE